MAGRRKTLATANTPDTPSAGTIPVRYIGNKEHGVTDRKFGTDIIWTCPGDIQDVPANPASGMCFHHPDVWADARDESEQKNVPLVPYKETPKIEEEDEREFRPLADLNSMTKDQLVEFGMRDFNMDLSEFDQPTIIDKLSVQVGGQRFK